MVNAVSILGSEAVSMIEIFYFKTIEFNFVFIFMLMDGKFRFGQRINLSYEYKLLKSGI